MRRQQNDNGSSIKIIIIKTVLTKMILYNIMKIPKWYKKFQC